MTQNNFLNIFWFTHRVGAPRSGITLLQYILRSHPALSLPTGESHFLIPLYRDVETYGGLSRPENVRRAMYRQSADFPDADRHGVKFDIDALTRELVAEERRSMHDIIAGPFEKNAQGEGKRRWGDKTPYYVPHLPKLLEWWPDAHIIHIIRDGRDVALSMFARRHDSRVYNTYEDGHEPGQQLSHDQYLEIRYEDMIAGQRGTLERICDFLGEEFSESVVAFRKSGGADKWRSAMAARQVRIFESGAGATLRCYRLFGPGPK